MNTVPVHGGWYCEIWPNGDAAVLVKDSRISLNADTIPLPPGGNLLQMRLSRDGKRVAGTGHHDGIAWEWRGVWVSHGTAFGNNACIYDASDQLQIVRGPDTETGALGWRYVDDNGVLMPAYLTYADGARRIWEYTERGGITVGQGDFDGQGFGGVHALFEGKRYLIGTGECTFVRFNRHGDQLAIAWVRQQPNPGAMLLWLSVSELRTLPEIAGPEEPDPEEPDPVSLPNHVEVVRFIDHALPHLLEQNTPDTVREFYWRATNALHDRDPKWGMLTKTISENGQEIKGQRVSLDAAAYQGTNEVVDFLTGAGDGPGKGGVVWQVKPRRPENVWLKPIPFEGEDPDEPEDPDDDEKDEQQDAEIAKLRRELAELRGRHDSLEARFNDLPPPTGVDLDKVTAAVVERLSKEYTTTPSGSGFLKHSHKVRIP